MIVYAWGESVSACECESCECEYECECVSLRSAHRCQLEALWDIRLRRVRRRRRRKNSKSSLRSSGEAWSERNGTTHTHIQTHTDTPCKLIGFAVELKPQPEPRLWSEAAATVTATECAQREKTNTKTETKRERERDTKALQFSIFTQRFSHDTGNFVGRLVALLNLPAKITYGTRRVRLKSTRVQQLTCNEREREKRL